jgi:hypothetical protein
MLDRVYHPFLFAAFPVLFLVQYNIRYLTPVQAVIPLAIALGVVTLMFLIGTRMFRADHRVLGVRLTILVVWFFAYGHIALLLADRFSSARMAHAILFPIWTALAIVLLIVARRLRGNGQALTRFLNGTAFVMLAVTVGSIVSSFAQGEASASEGGPPFPTVRLTAEDATPPNIYYLVFDRYAGADTLREVHGFDNSPFLGELAKRGFSVEGDSRSNYPSTSLSLASSLNMSYLDVLERYAGPADESALPVQRAVQENAVGRSLRAAGYRYVHIGSWWDGTRRSPIADRTYEMYPLSEYDRTL